MRLFEIPQSLLSILILISISPSQTTATPLPLDDISLTNATIIERTCAYPCGYYDQLCCESANACYTDSSGQAQCGAGSGGGVTQAASGWAFYTTTYVETDLETRTSTYSSFLGSTSASYATPTGSSCNYALNESPCGSICCKSTQYCVVAGQCASSGGGSSGSGAFSSFYSSMTASAPLRPTTGTIVTVTSTGSATTTVPFQTPVASDGSSLGGMAVHNNGLSAGAIAGIVIGVILGILFLLFLCACLCFKSALDGLLALLGLGKKSKHTHEETYVEERRSRHSGGAGRTWFGARPARPERRERERKSSGLGGIAGVGAALGALALILGLKRRNDKRDEKSETYYSGSSYYTDDYTTSASEYI